MDLALFPIPTVDTTDRIPGQLDLLDAIADATTTTPTVDVMPCPAGVLWDIPELRGQMVLA